MESAGKKRGNAKGATSDVVAAKVREIRQERQLDLAALSERLTDLGWPIPVAALSRLENGNRRVDVDDLFALANALDVSPIVLLGDSDADPLGTALPENALSPEVLAWLRNDMPSFRGGDRQLYWHARIRHTQEKIKQMERHIRHFTEDGGGMIKYANEARARLERLREREQQAFDRFEEFRNESNGVIEVDFPWGDEDDF